MPNRYTASCQMCEGLRISKARSDSTIDHLAAERAAMRKALEAIGVERDRLQQHITHLMDLIRKVGKLQGRRHEGSCVIFRSGNDPMVPCNCGAAETNQYICQAAKLAAGG